MSSKHTLCVVQPFDPRGKKIGGIESHIRELIRSAPDDIEVVLIAIDEIGDLKPRVMQTALFEGRTFQIMPLLRRLDEAHLRAATRLRNSLTLQFFLAFLRDLPRIRQVLHGRRASLEIQRLEYATFGKLLSLPTVQIIHGESRPDRPMDSLLRKFWFIQRMNERLAIRFSTRLVGVSPTITEDLSKRFPDVSAKLSVMTVSVNSSLFKLAGEFPPMDPFCIVYAGRLDVFKRPDLIFRVIHRLNEVCDCPIQFHYIGGSDPTLFPDFESVRDLVVSHGVRTSAEIAAMLERMHAGIMMSEFEGMPVYLLELLSTGRPVVALELPQFHLVIKDGVSGFVVKREAAEEDSVRSVADHFIKLKGLIETAAIDIEKVRDCIAPFSTSIQMAKLFDMHRCLSRRDGS